jgi:hypothetical protein
MGHAVVLREGKEGEEGEPQGRGSFYMRTTTLTGPEATVRLEDENWAGKVRAALYFAFVRIPKAARQWERWFAMWLSGLKNSQSDVYVGVIGETSFDFVLFVTVVEI